MHWTHIPSHWLRLHIHDVTIGITTMILVVGGFYINAAMKRMTSKLNWLLRYALFVLLSTLGYGLLMHYLTSYAEGTLLSLSDPKLLGAVIGIHLLLAWLLKRDKTI